MKLTQLVLLGFTIATLSAACSTSDAPKGIDDGEPRLKWTFLRERPIGTSPAVAGDTVLVGSDDGSLYALDAETGKKLWEFETSRQIRSIPRIVDGVAYFGNHGSVMYAVDVETGDEIWSFGATGSIWAAPAVADGTVYFGTGFNKFYALDARTGQLRWQMDLREDGRRVHSNAGPVVSGDLVYQVSTLLMSFDSFFNAIDRRTGYVKWSLQIDGGAVPPTVSENTAFVSARGAQGSGWLYAIDLDTHQTRWVYQTEDEALVRTSPAVAVGLVLIGDSEGRLTAIDVDSGQVKWTFDSGSDFLTSLTVVDHLVYYGDVDGAIVAVDATKGTESWRYQTVLGGFDDADCDFNVTCGLTSSPVVVDGSVYIVNPAGYLYALD